jgi:surface protein
MRSDACGRIKASQISLLLERETCRESFRLFAGNYWKGNGCGGNGSTSRWDVSRVTNMNFMFKGASLFNGDISQWDVRNVQNMRQMFCGASHFDMDLSRWNIGRREMWNTFEMFDGSPQSVERCTRPGRELSKAL